MTFARCDWRQLITKATVSPAPTTKSPRVVKSSPRSGTSVRNSTSSGPTMALSP